jgi:hypothetical protein
MDAAVRKLVRERAGDRCEYCRSSQREGASVRFHVEHVRPRQHGGDDNPVNLALACPTCNWNKGPNMTAVDPTTELLTRLYNPRIDAWKEHFALVGLEIFGLTSVGRATVRLLRINDPEHIELRRELHARGELDLGTENP